MSTASMRSFERRKSAHGRLQSSMSLVPVDTAERKGAAQGPGERAEEKRRSRRVKSARETRQEQESSAKIFPEAGLGVRRDAGAWGSTQYGDDFGPKQPHTPVPVRPISPTRRNNPQPAMPFLQWKHPVRIHTHKKAVHPPEEAWKYISEGFYDDYTDTRNTGDAHNEVPVTNLATIEFPGKKKDGTMSTPHMMTGVSGTKAQLNPRAVTFKSCPADLTPLRPPSPKSRMMHNTVKGNTLPVLREWLKTASSKERGIVLQMLTAAHSDSEDTRLQKAVDDVLQPDSAVRVQQWLQSTGSSERKILLGVLETLAIASGDTPFYPQPELNLPAAAWHLPAQHYRAYSYPISLRTQVSHQDRNHNGNHTQSSHTGRYSRHSHSHHHHSHSSHKPHCHKAHKSDSAIRVGADSHKETERDMALVGKRVGTKREKTPELWNHKVEPPHEHHVIHPSSVFLQPHKNRGRHYTIHPEWPTA